VTAQHPEISAWAKTPWRDLWALDKLILSRALGYSCGPAGQPVPKAGEYIVRPCVNAFGMGLNAFRAHITDSTDHLPPGSFWCEVFEGPHLSVDYARTHQWGYQPELVVEGHRRGGQWEPLWRWEKWTRLPIDMALAFPEALTLLLHAPITINVEFIGGRPIEVHFRRNTDFDGGIEEYRPVWVGEDTTPPEGFTFRPDADGPRIGAFVR